jgi:hypothetical protein
VQVYLLHWISAGREKKAQRKKDERNERVEVKEYRKTAFSRENIKEATKSTES